MFRRETARRISIHFVFGLCPESYSLILIRVGPAWEYYPAFKKLESHFCQLLFLSKKRLVIPQTKYEVQTQLVLIYSQSTTNKMQRSSNLFICFCKTLYMFQKCCTSIIRSTKLHIQRQAFVRRLLLPAASQSSSRSYRFADSLRASCQQTCKETCMTYTIAVCTVQNSWWRTEELSETCRSLFQK